jgi:phosphoglycerate dehydrogenase-like enzyme
MPADSIPSKDRLTICFAHAAYQLQDHFLRRQIGIDSFEVRTREELERRVGEADVVVVSGLWRNDLLGGAQRLRFIQSVSAGTDQFDREKLKERGVRLASARGVNARAVSEHAMALILALARKLPEARDNQAKHNWRGMISDVNQREDELGGKTLLIIGLGDIGSRAARLARAFDLRVVGIKRDPTTGGQDADSVHGLAKLKTLLPQADFVLLTCPLTKETERIIDAAALSRMKKSAYLVNAARGGCVDENALIKALQDGTIAGAAIDVAAQEPLPSTSPLWDFPNVLITPHTAGETRRYEDNVLDILVENLERLWRGESRLRNEVV